MFNKDSIYICWSSIYIKIYFRKVATGVTVLFFIDAVKVAEIGEDEEWLQGGDTAMLLKWFF